MGFFWKLTVVGLITFFGMPVSVVAPVAWGDCNEQQQKDIQKYLKGAQAIASRNNERLRDLRRYLHDWVQVDVVGSSGFDEKTLPSVISTKWTYNFFVDRRVQQYRGRKAIEEDRDKRVMKTVDPSDLALVTAPRKLRGDYKREQRIAINDAALRNNKIEHEQQMQANREVKQESLTLGILDHFIYRNEYLNTTISVLNADPTTIKNPKEPNITFECSDKWIEPREEHEANKTKEATSRMVNGVIRTISQLFRDIRKGPGPSMPDFGLPEDISQSHGSKPFDGDSPLDLFSVSYENETVISINPREFDIWNMKSDPAGDLAEAIRKGETDYGTMRTNDSIRDGDFEIQNMIRHHGEIHLLALLATNERFVGRTNVVSPSRDDPCLTYSKPPDQKNLNFECVYEMAKVDPKSSLRSYYAFSLLAVALYLDKWDWSDGKNRLLSSAISGGSPSGLPGPPREQSSTMGTAQQAPEKPPQDQRPPKTPEPEQTMPEKQGLDESSPNESPREGPPQE